MPQQERSDDSKPTEAHTAASAKQKTGSAAGSRSECEPFREIILAKLAQGLSAIRIHQDLVSEHGFAAGYYSVMRYIRR